MTGNTTARTQAIELGEHLREVAAWNVRLHLAKEELEQQALCEAAGVTKATISARMNLDAAWDLNAIAAAAVTLGMPPAELLDDTLYDIVNNDDTNTNEGKGASLVAALTSTLLARHIAGRCDPLKTKGSCRITMMATGANRYPQRETKHTPTFCSTKAQSCNNWLLPVQTMVISEREGPPVLHHVRLKSGISPRREGMNKPRIGE